MIEIYSDIPESVRERAKFWVDFALQQKNPMDGIKMIADYANSCSNLHEQDFVDFYFKLRMEQLRNENNLN